MKNSRLGCLTPAGLISAGLTVLIVVGFAFLRGGAIFSPGTLNAQPGASLQGFTSHAEFGDQCSLCHAPFWETQGMSARCEACHTAVHADLSDPVSLHGAIMVYNPGATCQSCHPDHHGPDGLLFNLKDMNFPHETVGWSLAGHASLPNGNPFTCAECHAQDLTTFDPLICQTCHTRLDAAYMADHLLSFGPACLDCHDGVDSYGADFDHSLVAFPLTGKHLDLPCSACHLDAPSIPALRLTPTACADCHTEDDAHLGSLGDDCASCHTTAGWSPSIYNHALSVFKLDGRHVDVECEDCHLEGVFKGTPTDCYACHAADDEHQGRYGTLCATCHSTLGWTPATFDHTLSIFPLTGAHVALNCDACHLQGVFKGTPTDCYACHAGDDAHSGRYGTNCAGCHTTGAWTPATFDHNLSVFKLTGAHASVSCETCHVNHVFQGTPTSCYACHAGDDAHSGRYGTNCAACHTTSAWTPATFDHNLASFRLTGAHAGLACTRCHTGGTFQGTPSACSACHADPPFHAGLFGGISCDQCHSTSSWSPASYNGSHPGGCDGNCINHEHASCRDCHTSTLNDATCAKCHDGDPGGGDD
jgi:hypothetical protein